jgi:hypothetical protein
VRKDSDVIVVFIIVAWLPLPVQRDHSSAAFFRSYNLVSQFYLGISVIAFFIPSQTGPTPADMAETDRGPGDGHWPLSDPKATQIISGEYYKNRQGHLACIASVCQIPEYV